MTPVTFTRDMIFYFIVTIYLLVIILVIEKINLVIAIGFLILYFFYVIITVYHGRKYGNAGDNEEVDKDKEEKFHIQSSLGSDFTSEIKNHSTIED